MTVVCDASPLCYLVLIGQIHILPKLYSDIITSKTVIAELNHAHSPAPVRAWASAPPNWLRIQHDPENVDASLSMLHPGERTVISLAQACDGIAMLDDNAARATAIQKGIKVSGLLGVLRDAAQNNLIQLDQAIERLRATSFRASPALLGSILKSDLGLRPPKTDRS